MKKLIFSIATAIAVVFSGCGGGGSDGAFISSSENNFTGIFVDDVVAGLTYECSSGKTDVTNTKGEYTCPTGDTVTFSVGGFVLGTTEASDVITPYSLVQNDTLKAVNIARLLQGLDDDGDPSNGITLQKDKVALFKGKAKDNFNFEEKFDSFFDDLPEITPPSPQKAKEHMDKAIANKGVYIDGNLFEDENAKLITLQQELLLTNSKQLKIFKTFDKDTASSHIEGMVTKDSKIYFFAYDYASTSTSVYEYDLEKKEYKTIYSFNGIYSDYDMKLAISDTNLYISKVEHNQILKTYTSKIITYNLTTKALSTKTLKDDFRVRDLFVLNNELFYFVENDSDNTYWIYSNLTDTSITNDHFTSNFSNIVEFNNSIYFKNDDGIHQLKKENDTYSVNEITNDSAYSIYVGSDYLYYNNGSKVAKIDSSNNLTDVSNEYINASLKIIDNKIFFKNSYTINYIDNDGNNNPISGFTSDSGSIYLLEVLNGYLYFIHKDGDTSTLYKTNGTSTQSVQEFNSFYDYYQYDIHDFITKNNALYLLIRDKQYGKEIFKITDSAIELELDFNKNPQDSSHVSDLSEANGLYYFFADDGETQSQLYKSDKTLAGTKMIKEVSTGQYTNLNLMKADEGSPYPYIVIGENIYYANTRTDSLLNRCDLNLENCEVIDNSTVVRTIIKTGSDSFYYTDRNSSAIHKSDTSLITNTNAYELHNILDQVVFDNKIYIINSDWEYNGIYVLDMKTDTLSKIDFSENINDGLFYIANDALYLSLYNTNLYKLEDNSFNEVALTYENDYSTRLFFTADDKLFAISSDKVDMAGMRLEENSTYYIWQINSDNTVKKQELELSLATISTNRDYISRQKEGAYIGVTDIQATSCEDKVIFINGTESRDLYTARYATYKEGESYLCFGGDR
ncbi:hypothetical protein [Halarcobacter sp.]|uniref:hypothetical protein n=1 Tax=Halarcobacter sp. TaxID=2321133 RepID=UPI002AABD761|nr:hypothetical protein [Halarcobacter sp.]